ncbi:ABC transporter ATP-binding protein [Janthinobacterium sp. SUN206]|uniref:ABC transporter ATP-binding protein n=1 Tax=Janthinobacterium sp. SUN206 TaxID=3014787 RepID=UPI002712E24E|nr:ABC transporter ATP-binding protein [Janthinobacterium sp. SUN206]MDO8068183.1 ABC transporter ATP-binding protein [Janthinobacterium sp. SUN206]
MRSQRRQPGPISRILHPIRGRLIAAALLAGTGSMLTLVPLAGIAQLAQIAMAPALAPDAVWPIIIASVACLFLGMALMSLGELAAHLADNRLTHRLRLQAMQRLGQVPLGWFTSRASGEVKQAMQDDINTLHSLTAHFYTTTGRAVGAIAISVIYLFAMDWRLALIAILPFPGFFLFFGRAMKASSGNMEQFVAGMGRINNAVVEFVNGIPVVKAFGATGRAHGSYRTAVDAFAEAFAAFTRPLVGSMANANALIAPVAVLGVVVLAGTAFVALDWMAPVDILPFALVAPGISAPMLLLHYLTHDLNNATGAAQRVQALLDTPVLAQPAPDEQQLPDGTEIRLEGVSYAYDGHNKVLSDITLTLQPGTVTAIVGASGSGKSTLARLLLRFFDPTEGRITLGGVDLRHIATPELYRRIGFVLQEVRLIHASVRENIALGRPSASMHEIEQAARLANIHERLLALPRGYDSVIGEDAQLSGGELQRVSIARAVLLDPSVLVLDEATAAADAENEVAIQDALSRFARDRTLLIIAHRLDTVMHADNIVVVENGAIVEQGSHAGLLADKGRYAQLWALGGYPDFQEDAVLPC